MAGSLSLGESPEEVLKKATPIERLPRYKADFELSATAALTPTHGVVFGESLPGGAIRQRQEIALGGLNGARKAQFNVVVATGKTCQFYSDQKLVLEMPGHSRLMDQVALDRFLAEPTNFDVGMRSETVSNSQYHVLLVKFLEPVLKLQQDVAQRMQMKVKVPVVARQERWVDARSYVVYQISNYDAQGSLISGIRYANLETNVDLPASLFEAPANATVMRPTNQSQIINAMARQTSTEILGGNPLLAAWLRYGRAIVLAVILMIIMVCAGVMIWIVLRLRRARRAPR